MTRFAPGGSRQRLWTPRNGRSLANRNFAEVSARGFLGVPSPRRGLWRLPRVQRADCAWSFRGAKRETCDIAGQFVPLLPKRRYSLSMHGRAEGVAPGTGVQWSILTVPDGKQIATGPLGFEGSEPADAVFSFDSLPRSVPTELLISYTRTHGQVRVEGKLWIDRVRLDLQP